MKTGRKSGRNLKQNQRKSDDHIFLNRQNAQILKS